MIIDYVVFLCGISCLETASLDISGDNLDIGSVPLMICSPQPPLPPSSPLTSKVTESTKIFKIDNKNQNFRE